MCPNHVGSTNRHLHQRILEHHDSTIGKHIIRMHSIVFKVLKKCTSKFDCFTCEMLFIRNINARKTFYLTFSYYLHLGTIPTGTKTFFPLSFITFWFVTCIFTLDLMMTWSKVKTSSKYFTNSFYNFYAFNNVLTLNFLSHNYEDRLSSLNVLIYWNNSWHM